MWADAWHNGYLNASQVTSLVNACNTYNYNAIIVQMRRRGDAWYMPQSPNLEPRTTAIASNFDALQTIIDQCHAASPRIQVHVWVPTMLIWSTQGTAPTQAGHVYNTHPEYLMKNTAGDTWIGEGYFLDPGNPDAMQWNYNMARDIVSRYDIDGFHWDYIRYPTTDSGYNDTSIARYNAEYGLSGIPAYTDTQFANWRRRQVTDFLRWTDADLLALKPNLTISASVFGSRSDAYNARFQDWRTWNYEGLYDLCIPMIYSTDNTGVYNPRVDDLAANQGVRWGIVGPGAYLNTKENTLVQLNYMHSAGLKGYSLYSYAVPNSGTIDQAGTLSYIKTNYQPTYSAAPDLPWKATPTKGILKGTITRSDNGAAVYNATVSITGKSMLSEPHGKYALFEVTPGTYTVTASSNGIMATGSATVVAGQVKTLDLVLPVGTATDFIIDNKAATTTGTWTTGTMSTDKYASDYIFKNGGDGSSYASFTPGIQVAGLYEVFEWHCKGTNRSTVTPHVVTYAGGTKTIYINQTVAGGAWNSLGTFYFNTGTGGNVRITDAFSTGVGIADAIRFTKKNEDRSATLTIHDPFDSPNQQPGGASSGWTVMGTVDPALIQHDFDTTNGAYRVRVMSSPSRCRQAGWINNRAEWLPYSSVGSQNYVRAKFYLYTQGAPTISDANQIPNFQIRVANRFAVTANLNVMSHSLADIPNNAYATELRPSSDPTNPSVYRVDFAPVNVPFLSTSTSNEGFLRAFEVYALDPQDDAYLGMTESSIGTYPASALADTASMQTKIYAPGDSDAGGLQLFHPSDLQAYNFVPAPPGVAGAICQMETTSPLANYTEGNWGVTLDTTPVPADRIGYIARTFYAGGADGSTDYPNRIRADENRLYKVRWHVTSTRPVEQQAGLWLQQRSIRFSYLHSIWLAGGCSSSPSNNLSIARQAMPGVGCANPDKMIPGENGGWYTAIMNTPLSRDIRPEFPSSTSLSARMPMITSLAGPGVDLSSDRDIKLSAQCYDTLSAGPGKESEAGVFTIDRIEVRVYESIQD